jgi:hypothetical protein
MRFFTHSVQRVRKSHTVIYRVVLLGTTAALQSNRGPRYRFFLEQKNLAASTINVRLAAVRRLAYEASDSGLLSPDLAAGIRRVKGAKRLGGRIGNWSPPARWHNRAHVRVVGSQILDFSMFGGRFPQPWAARSNFLNRLHYIFGAHPGRSASILSAPTRKAGQRGVL